MKKIRTVLSAAAILFLIFIAAMGVCMARSDYYPPNSHNWIYKDDKSYPTWRQETEKVIVKMGEEVKELRKDNERLSEEIREIKKEMAELKKKSNK